MKTLKNLAHWTSSFSTTPPYPILFIGHGSPMNAVEHNTFTQSWQKLGTHLPTPNAILVISAHWETRGTKVMQLEAPATIHDFRGFPPELFAVNYPAPGHPQLAFDIQQLLINHDAQLDQQWGLDHGTWSILKHIYPQANVPVLQLSLNTQMTLSQHVQLASELQILRTKGVLIVGSGNMVHNLGMMNWNTQNGFTWAQEANTLFKQNIENQNISNLIQYQNLGSAVQMAIPSPEHYLPLLYIMALQTEHEKPLFFNDQLLLGSISMTSVAYGITSF